MRRLVAKSLHALREGDRADGVDETDIGGNVPLVVLFAQEQVELVVAPLEAAPKECHEQQAAGGEPIVLGSVGREPPGVPAIVSHADVSGHQRLTSPQRLGRGDVVVHESPQQRDVARIGEQVPRSGALVLCRLPRDALIEHGRIVVHAEPDRSQLLLESARLPPPIGDQLGPLLTDVGFERAPFAETPPVNEG